MAVAYAIVGWLLIQIAAARPAPDNVAVIARIYDQAMLRRRYPEAIGFLQTTVSQTISIAQRNEYRLWLGNIQRLSGDIVAANTTSTAARVDLEGLLNSQPNNLDIIDTLALLCADLADKEAGLKFAEDAVRLMPVTKDALGGRSAEMTRAIVYSRFGERDRAIPALERLLTLPGPAAGYPATLRLNPEFDLLRGDPGFQKLCVVK